MANNDSCTHDCSTCGASCSSRSQESLLAPQNPLSNVRHVIGIVSGKGGVGKSLITSALSVAFRRRDYRTAILDADVIMCNEATNKISITDIKDTGIDIKFDYMEPRNGCVLQIMYTGKKEDLEVTLKIKGGHIKKIDTE